MMVDGRQYCEGTENLWDLEEFSCCSCFQHSVFKCYRKYQFMLLICFKKIYKPVSKVNM